MKTNILTIISLLAFASVAQAGELDIQKESAVAAQFEKIGTQTISWLEAEEILVKEAAKIGTIENGITEEKLINAYGDRVGPDAAEVNLADLVSFVNDLDKKLVSDGPSRDVAPSDGPSRSVAPSDGPSRSVAPSDGPSVALPPSDGPSFSKNAAFSNSNDGFKAPDQGLAADGPDAGRAGNRPGNTRPQGERPRTGTDGGTNRGNSRRQGGTVNWDGQRAPSQGRAPTLVNSWKDTETKPSKQDSTTAESGKLDKPEAKPETVKPEDTKPEGKPETTTKTPNPDSETPNPDGVDPRPNPAGYTPRQILIKGYTPQDYRPQGFTPAD